MLDFEEGTFIWAHNFKQVTAQMHVGEKSLSGVFKWKEAFPLRARPPQPIRTQRQLDRFTPSGAIHHGILCAKHWTHEMDAEWKAMHLTAVEVLCWGSSSVQVWVGSGRRCLGCDSNFCVGFRPGRYIFLGGQSGLASSVAPEATPKHYAETLRSHSIPPSISIRWSLT